MRKVNKMNKKKIMIFSIIGVLVLGIIIYLIGTSIATTDSTILKNQVVDGLSFEDASLVYEDGISTFTVNVTNENKDTYSLNYVEIKLTDTNDNETILIGYIGNEIGSDEVQTIVASIDKDVTESKKLEYVINK